MIAYAETGDVKMAERRKVYEGSEPFVFVSYAHKDSDIVLPLVRGLQERGFRMWYDGGLEVGAEWPDYIAEHLEKCSCVLAFASANFGNSHNCRREVNFAIELRKDPIVIYLEDREKLGAGMRMQLGALHAMFYDRYPDADAFLNELSAAEIIRPCREAAAPEPQAVQPDAEYSTIEFAGDEQPVAPVDVLGAVTADGEVMYLPSEPLEDPEKLFRQAEALCQEEKYEEAAILYTKAAEEGHIGAQYCLGKCYLNGYGVVKTYTEALKWYHKAADRGSADACYALAGCYEGGKGVAMDFRNALEWYKKAMALGHPKAEEAIKLCKTRQKMHEEFLQYLAEANRGNAEAQNKLADCFRYGKGVFKSEGEAVKWYRKAAEQDYPEAQYNLGYCFYMGNGVGKDHNQAAKWFREAATKWNHPAACFWLGVCYEKGHGLSQSFRQALKWYRKAKEYNVNVLNGFAVDDAIKRCEENLRWWMI